MDRVLVFKILILIVLVPLGVVIYFVLRKSREPDMRSMMSSYANADVNKIRGNSGRNLSEKDFENINKLKEEARRKVGGKKQLTLEERLFQAGIYTPKAKADFQRLRVLLPIFTVPLLAAPVWVYMGASMGLVGAVMGVLVGIQIPYSILDRRVQHRHEEILYFLPLVIEQMVIGVSSSLDIGPCLQKIVSMADERDSHNVVTELLRYALYYVKSGVSFEDAMVEIGKAAGHTELKHALLFLSQVAKHGGEITRQLQELAEAVTRQREGYVEEKIKKLELLATAPVTLVFFGFLIILMSGFGIQVMDAF